MAVRGVMSGCDGNTNEERTHSTIGDVTPQEFMHNYQTRAQLTQECASSAVA